VLRDAKVVAEEVRTLLRLHQCVGVVVGLPLTLDFQLDEQCEKTIEFIQQIQREWNKRTPPKAHPTPVTKNAAALKLASPSASSSPLLLPPFHPPSFFFWDERLSSAAARHELEVAGGMKQRSRAMAQQTDPLAAAIILREFLQRMQLAVRESNQR
jgi:RNase H-fold protein (predicted Holliday junction resolvase)